MTPGTIGVLRGEHLKVTPGNPDEGVFFIARSTGHETQAGELTRNTPKQLIFLVPPLMPGEVYRVSVRARPRDCKTLRAGKLKHPLTCVAP